MPTPHCIQRILPGTRSGVLALARLSLGAYNVPQRTFLKNTQTKQNIPIYAIGLSLYESLPGTTAEMIGEEVVRTQWL